MKNIITSLYFLLVSVIVSAQTNIPQFINFQAVAIDNQGNPLTNSFVLIRITARQGGPNGNAIYCGLHTLPTDAFGTFSFKMNQNPIGINCNGATSSFLDIPWESGAYWLEVEYSYDNGQNYTVVDPIELSSVPYAFVARRVERISTEGAVEGQVLKFNSTKNRFEPGPDNFQDGGGNGLTQQYPDLKSFEDQLSVNGAANLTAGETFVKFPETVATFCQENTGKYQYTVMLTPLSADSKGMAVVEKNETGFKVKELFGGIGNYAFDWEIKIALVETPQSALKAASQKK